MINPILTKMLAWGIPGGSFGVYPMYMNYMSMNSAGGGMGQITLSASQLNGDIRAGNLATLVATFKGGGAPTYLNGTTAVGFSRSVGGLALDNAVRNRAHGTPAQSTATGDLHCPGLSASVNHALVLRNAYMGSNSSVYPVLESDFTTDHDVQTTRAYPQVITDLDAAVITDPVEFAFNPVLDVSLRLVPKVLPTPPVANTEFVKFMESRMRDVNNMSYDISNSQSPAYPGASAQLNVQAFCEYLSDNPYLAGQPLGGYYPGNSYSTYTPPSIALRSTDLEVTDPTKLMRLNGVNYTPTGWSDPMSLTTTTYNPGLLKFTLAPDSGYSSYLNPNGLLLTLLSSRCRWYSPVIGFLSADRVLTPGVGAIESGPYIGLSNQMFGFSADSSGAMVATADSRAPRTVVDVARIDRPGPTGTATYFVERYHRSLIAACLSRHLPRANPDGSEADYFTKGTFLQVSPGYTSTTDFEFGHQMVAFPMAQQPEDTWLYYVSMDEEYNYWLNRQELGTGHVSEALLALELPPIQMEVFNGLLWMAYASKIVVYNISTGVTTTYGSSSGVPSQITAIAIDREAGKVYVGHVAGVFEFTNTTAVALTLVTISAAQSRVATCRLVAVNGYVSWTTSDAEVYGYDNVDWVCRYVVATATVQAWEYREVLRDNRSTDNLSYADYYNGASRRASLYAVGLRSNGDMLVMHSEVLASDSDKPNLIWIGVNTDGTLLRKSEFPSLQGCGISDPLSQNGYRYTARILRVDDFHYSIYGLPVLKVRSATDNTLGMCLPNGYSAAVGFPWTSDVRIDDAECTIYRYLQDKSDYYRSSQDIRMTVHQNEQTVAAIPVGLFYLRACDYPYAINSVALVILDQAYSVFVCGVQVPTSIGVELDWDGSSWVHGTAGTAKRARKTHTSSEFVNPWTKIAFSSGATFTGLTAYRVKTFPNTSTPIPTLAYYLGDLVPASVTLTITGTKTLIPADIDSPMYCGIEYERPDLLTCVVNGITLTYVAGAATPDATQFSMYRNYLYLDSSHIGQTLTFSYSYVKAVEA